MITNYSKTFLLLSLPLVVFFTFASLSYSEEGNFDKEKALRVVSEQGGPGGCNSEASCKNFCDNPDNLKTCMSWAKDNGVTTEENFEKHSEFIERGGPGGCRTPETCREFCENPQNHAICIDHAVKEGFMTREEADQIKEFKKRGEEFIKKAEEFRKQDEFERSESDEIDPGFDEEKALEIITAQGGPGGCRTFEECENFCESPDNQVTCFEFADKNNLFTNREQAEKIKLIMKEGGPGGCRGEKECHQFCENEANFEVCIEFAKKNNMMPPEEIERAQKGIQAMKEGGPGGCKSKSECEKFCQESANQEICFEWAKKNGLISEEELKFMEEAEEMRAKFEERRKEFETRDREDFKPPEGFGAPSGDFRPPEGFRPTEFDRPPEFREFNNPPQEFDPEKMCAEKGGLWTGSNCEFSGQQEFIPPEGFYQPPIQNFQDFNQENSEMQENFSDPSSECAKHGGSWTGTNCMFQEQSPTSFLRGIPLLGALIGYLFN